MQEDLNYLRKASGSKYLYTMRKNNQGEFIYVVDGWDYEGEDFSHLGDIEEESLQEYDKALGGEFHIGTEIEDTEWGTLISTYYPLKDNSGQIVGFIGVDYDVESEYLAFKSFRLYILISALILSALALLSGLFLSRYITSPIKKMAEAAKQISQLDLNVERIEVKNRDEIGITVDAFNIMVDNLRIIIGRLTDASEAIKENNYHVEIAAKDASVAMGDITRNISDIASGSENTSSNVIELSHILSNLTAASQETASNSEEASNESRDMNIASTSGVDSILKIINKIKVIEESTEDTYVIVKDLVDKTKDIDRIIMVINDISDQTNLLALNANIEAARAGESGKGFSVVAQEVRKLAEETKAYSNEISSMIGSIIKNTVKASDSMSHVKLAVDDSTKAANSTKGIFEGLQKKVSNTNILIEGISRVAEDQARSAEGILEKAEEVSAISEETTAVCEDTESKSQNIMVSVERIVESISKFKSVSEELNDLINKFTI